MGIRLFIPILSVIFLVLFRICSPSDTDNKIVLCTETETIECNSQQIYKLTPVAEFVSMNLCGLEEFDLKIIQNQKELDSLRICSGIKMSNIDLCGQTIIAGSVTCPDSSYEIVEAILTPDCPFYNLTIIQKKTNTIGTLEKGSNDFIYILPELPENIQISFRQVVKNSELAIDEKFDLEEVFAGL